MNGYKALAGGPGPRGANGNRRAADRPETKSQSHWFADKLKEAGVKAKVVAAEGKTHGTINSELGLPDDKPTNQGGVSIPG